MSCTASINPLSALPPGPCLSQPTSAYIFTVSPQSGRSVFISKTSNLLCCPSDGLDPHSIHPGLGQREPKSFHLPFLQLRPLSFPSGTAVSKPRNTAEHHHRFVHRRLHSRWCSLLHIAPDAFLHRLHQAPTALPALSIAAPKKKKRGRQFKYWRVLIVDLCRKFF